MNGNRKILSLIKNMVYVYYSNKFGLLWFTYVYYSNKFRTLIFYNTFSQFHFKLDPLLLLLLFLTCSKTNTPILLFLPWLEARNSYPSISILSIISILCGEILENDLLI
uniref:Uncharacterized protein n=1 Tax=Cacopsylla melanoneura TaxID=428564 RepID=A0A8D8QDC7_9HEMI